MKTIERFENKIKENGLCWDWIGYKNPDGYGRFRLNTKKVELAHRFSYSYFRGKLPKRLTIDHVCKNRKCVNSDHLDPVSIQENLLRGNSPQTMNRNKTHCIHGHPLFGLNLRIDHYKNKQFRRCITCLRIRSKNRSKRP